MLGQQSSKSLSAIESEAIDSQNGVTLDAVFTMAASAEEANNYALAVLYYEKAMEIWGDRADIFRKIGILQRDMGRYTDAGSSLLRAIQLDPGSAKNPFELGELYLKEKKYTEAKKSYLLAATLSPEWNLVAERLLELKSIIKSAAGLEERDEEEVIAKEESVDALSRGDIDHRIDPWLFNPTRLEVTHNHRPSFVTTFIGIHQRTRWGAGPVVRGIESFRGYINSIIPYHQIEIYIDGILVHQGGLTVGSIYNERSDARIKKYAFNAWIDFTKLSTGWHEVIFRASGLGGSVEEGVNWKKERFIVAEALPDDFFVEATARLPKLNADSNISIVEQVRKLPSVIAEATPNSYPGPIRNVAVLRLDGLGDVAVSVPFFLHLRALLPNANIVAIASNDNADGCRALGLFDEVISVDFPESPYKQGRFLDEDQQFDLMDKLKKYKFDLAITGMVSDGPRQLSVMTGAPVTIGFGGDDIKSLNIYYDSRDLKSGGNILNYAARYEMLAKALEVWKDSGAKIQRREDLSRNLLEKYGINAIDEFVVLHAGSRIKSTEWPGYAALANKVARDLGIKVVYIANDANQKAHLDVNSLSEGQVIFIDGLIPFDDFDAMLSYCATFVGNDSGPGHLATLRGAKAIRIISARLGGSEWKSEMSGVCVYRRVPCAGCGSIPISKQEECTYDIACVKDISVDEIYQQVLRFVQPLGVTGNSDTHSPISVN